MNVHGLLTHAMVQELPLNTNHDWGVADLFTTKPDKFLTFGCLDQPLFVAVFEQVQHSSFCRHRIVQFLRAKQRK